jgi:hypothetical protein
MAARHDSRRGHRPRPRAPGVARRAQEGAIKEGTPSHFEDETTSS